MDNGKINCPNCGEVFALDDAGYANILKQVRDSEFEQQLGERLQLAEKDKLTAVELAKEKAGAELQKTGAAKDAEIQELKSKLDAGEVTKELAVTQARSAVEKERDELASELKQAKLDSETASKLAEANLLKEIQETAAKKDAEIQDLKAKLNSNEVAQKLAITEAVNGVEKERDKLENGLKQAELEKQLAEKSLTDKYETQIKGMRLFGHPIDNG